MSFSVVAYTNESPTNFVNKKITQVGEFNGNLRAGSSIIDPVILFEADNPGFESNHVNYLYISEFGRYYYITDIISNFTSLWEIHCHVDVLMSFAEQIKEQTAIVARQESQYNMMLDDGFFMCYQNPKIQTKTFSVEGPFEHQEFVLVVAGSSTATSPSVDEESSSEEN